MTDTLLPMARINLTPEEQRQALAVATKIANLFDRGKRLTYVAALVTENISLQKEANLHRQARGYQPLKTHDIDASKVG